MTDWRGIPTEYQNQIVTGDARELAQRLPDESIDLFVLDPPYGLGYRSSRKTDNRGRPRKTDADFGDDILDPSFIPDVARSLKKTGALYLFTRWDVMAEWKTAVKNAGLKVVQRIVWDKAHWGMGDLRYYGSQTEDILFCRKGLHVLNWQKREGNIWRATSKACFSEGCYDHPSQKPESLIEKMIRYSCPPDGIVCDLHSGSGTTAAVAKRLGVRFIACDKKQKYVQMGRERLSQVRLDSPPLPLVMPQQLELI